MRTKDLVTIGQQWRRRRTKDIWTIRQVWRADTQVLAIDVDGEHETISFSHLRRYYELVA